VAKTLALDANVLVLLTVGLADVRYIARHKNLYIARHKNLHPTYRVEHFDLLLDEVKRAPGLATTTHVLTETSNLLRQCKEPMRSEIMAALADFIGEGEELTPEATRASAAPEFLRLGLTDAAFTLLDPARYCVLSADLDLIVALQTRGFEVVNFHALLFD